jgi:predicted phage baseplate assembly protein
MTERDCACDPPPSGRAPNRAGLPEIAFRTGTQPTFLARMLDALPRQEVPDPRAGGAPHAPLGALTTRRLDDPAIALLDAWACALDVLAFQQERIANEAYLGTATERLSVRELARAIGYELAPGVAAETRLAFQVESADDPFRSVTVPAGTQVMSVPSKPGDLPQTFETLEPVEAHADFNAIPPRLERQQVLALRRLPNNADPVLVLVDTDESFDIPAGSTAARQDVTAANVAEFHPLDPAIDFDRVLDERAADTRVQRASVVLPAIAVDEIRLRGLSTGLAPGDRLLAVGRRGTAVEALPLLVREVALEPGFDQTRVVVQPLGTAEKPDPSSASTPSVPTVPLLRPSKGLAFRTPLLRTGIVARAPLPLERDSIAGELRRTAWRAADLQAMVQVQRWSIRTLLAVLRQPPPAIAPPLGSAVPGIHALRVRTGFFGNAAPRQEMLAKPDNQRATDGLGKSWDAPPLPSIWQDSQGTLLGAAADVFLERAVEGVGPDSWVVIEAPDPTAGAGVTRTLSLRVNRAVTVSRADFALSGRTTGLLLNALNGSDLAEANKLPYLTFRTASANLGSARLPLAGLPIAENLTKGEQDLTLARLVLELLPGAAVALSGERADAPGVRADEIAILSDVRHIGGFTRLSFASGLAQSFRRPGLAVNANIARASHGETVSQPLGSGDARVANQAFALPRLPLTFLKDKTPPGRRSTLAIHVDGLAWEERPGLYESSPADRHFMLRLDEDGTTRVVFGDGLRGARLPSGSLNVVATWRVGTGPVGEVPDGALTLLRTRPLSIRSVVNPDATTGASATERMEEARLNAPSTVRTLGRIVSLEDYEDAARTWPGFGKARAELVWHRGERVVHVTVGLAKGLAPLPTSPELATLRAALDGIRDGADRVMVQGFAERPFAINARLRSDPARDAAAVRAAAQSALEAGFGFAARDFAAPVTGAQVLAVLQAVPGVVAADLRALDPVEARSGGSAGHSALLRAEPARSDLVGVLQPAELLLVSPAHIALTSEPAHAG